MELEVQLTDSARPVAPSEHGQLNVEMALKWWYS